MVTYEQFQSTILTGNYALTKSMELTKVQSSGTLWYIKKFLILYFYVFLSNDIMTHEYVDKVVECFEVYINSLPETIQDDARQFFYPDNPSINFHSENFRTFASFASINNFENHAERTEYYQKAKKMYFAILMGSGGQTGVKKNLKESVLQSEFVYSKNNINNAIMDGVVSTCKEQIVNGASLTDNSVKYIISSQSINEMINVSTREVLTEQSITSIIAAYNNHGYAFNSIENDMVAFIRNERQILYYYGYFHSKTAGATDFEFSSLTPVGELALKANYYEFLAIWEHQKIKMISQPATADINKIVSCINSVEKFGISYSPYIDIIGHILRQGTLTLEQYKYIVSRRKHDISEDEWIQIENEAIGHIEDIKQILIDAGRVRDISDEDGRKELLKYILGLRADLPIDRGTNIYGVVEMRRSCISTDRNALQHIYDIYSKLQNYKVLKYGELFLACEKDLKCRYISGLNGDNIEINPHVKISWDLYNIRPDKFILLTSIFSIIAKSLDIALIGSDVTIIMENMLNQLNFKFPILLRSLGYSSDNAKKQIIRKVLNALNNDDYSSFMFDEVGEHDQSIADYRNASAEDLYARIEEISFNTSINMGENRVRNTNLISLLKSYYMAVYLEDSMLRCECCGDETFITDAGEPYIEFHHLIPFNIANGPDHFLNLFALCPSCHKKIHFLRLLDKQKIYADLNANNYMAISFVDRLRNLKDGMILRSYHLEYLLAENAITIEEYESIAA